ncbi:MAG: 2-hydroxy-3-oxopropionate reductase [Solirubrobacterales bacterium]|jgi:2-hydroxy-3-oxopropionate reductase|nr:2-hydroxy-3-oxopropionate reductase [Solirubrobacterales bacterium]
MGDLDNRLPSEVAETIGFIGLGIMGSRMAANLLSAGADLLVWNRHPEPAEKLRQAGARVARSPKEIVEQAAIIITMLSDDAAVEQVLEEQGVIAAAKPGTLIIDMSTISPKTARDLAERCHEEGLDFLDAPVSGGDVGAEAATLSIMVGGTPEAVERAAPIFDVLGSTTIHTGESGSGQVVKACNQVMVAVIFAGVSEALVLGSKLGLDRAAVLDAIDGGLASNRIMDVRRRNFLEQDFTPGFKIDHHRKDLDIALSSAEEVGAELPLATIIQGMFKQLQAAGYGGEDDSSLLRLAEAAANGEAWASGEPPASAT